jgi:hypothetical protein
MAADRPRLGLHHPTVVPTNFDPDSPRGVNPPPEEGAGEGLPDRGDREDPAAPAADGPA